MSTSIKTENIRSLKREEPAVEERLPLTAFSAEIDGSRGVTLPGYPLGWEDDFARRTWQKT